MSDQTFLLSLHASLLATLASGGEGRICKHYILILPYSTMLYSIRSCEKSKKIKKKIMECITARGNVLILNCTATATVGTSSVRQGPPPPAPSPTTMQSTLSQPRPGGRKEGRRKALVFADQLLGYHAPVTPVFIFFLFQNSIAA